MTQSLHSLLIAVGLEVPSGLADPLIGSVSCDSRKVDEGCLFFGLPGEKVDGGIFWPQALEAGASAAVIGSAAARERPPGPRDLVVVVPDPVEKWVGELAATFWGKPASKMMLIGVTGTNGKTTTTHLIEYLTSVLGSPAALFGTLVNRWPNHSSIATNTTGFPDLLQAQLAKAVVAGAKVAAMEVSSHALDQQRVAGCIFAGAIFTNLTQDHLDYHYSMEAYFEAKTLLFKSSLLERGKNRAIVNIDNVWGARLAKDLGDICWRSTLSEETYASLKVELCIADMEITSNGMKGRLLSPLGDGKFESNLIGQFNMMNLLQAVGVLLQQGFPLPDLLAAIKDFSGVPGRMQLVKLPESMVRKHLPLVLVDYAHTPDGLENALNALRTFVSGKLICVFGCGGDRDRGKRPQMGAIASKLSDRVFLTSDNPRTEDPQQIMHDVISGIPPGTHLSVEVDRATAIANAIAGTSPGDVVLIAGKGHENYQIMGLKKISFDDRDEAEKALQRRSENL